MSTNKRELVKEIAAEALSGSLDVAGATKIDDYTYVIPCSFEDEEKPYYARVTITACLAKDTKKNKAFDLETAVAAYEAKVAKREADAAKKAAEKAAKETED